MESDSVEVKGHDDLDQELSLLRTSLKPPQTFSYDNSTRTFTTDFCGAHMTLILPVGYPHHSGSLRVSIHPPNEEVLNRVHDLMTDVLPGEFMIVPMCQAMRSILESQRSAESASDALRNGSAPLHVHLASQPPGGPHTATHHPNAPAPIQNVSTFPFGPSSMTVGTLESSATSFVPSSVLQTHDPTRSIPTGGPSHVGTVRTPPEGLFNSKDFLDCITSSNIHSSAGGGVVLPLSMGPSGRRQPAAHGGVSALTSMVAPPPPPLSGVVHSLNGPYVPTTSPGVKNHSNDPLSWISQLQSQLETVSNPSNGSRNVSMGKDFHSERNPSHEETPHAVDGGSLLNSPPSKRGARSETRNSKIAARGDQNTNNNNNNVIMNKNAAHPQNRNLNNVHHPFQSLPRSLETDNNSRMHSQRMGGSGEGNTKSHRSNRGQSVNNVSPSPHSSPSSNMSNRVHNKNTGHMPTHTAGGRRRIGAFHSSPEKVLNRLLFDPIFKAADFDVGVVTTENASEINWIPLAEYQSEHQGIPHDSIVLFRYLKEEIIWDRQERMDGIEVLTNRLLHGLSSDRRLRCTNTTPMEGFSADSPTTESQRRMRDLSFKPLIGAYPMLEFLDHTKPTGTNLAETVPRSFSIMTWNIQCGLFDKDNKLRSDERLPLQIATLEQCPADIIALQEVTHDVYESLLKSEKLSKRYFITKLPNDVTIGQVTMSRFAMEKVQLIRLSMQKHAILSSHRSVTGRTLTTVNIHLISDYAKDATSRRLQELAAIAKQLEGEHDVVVCGDFNFGDKDIEEETVPWGALLDTWHILRGSEPGYTVDVEKNSLAVAMIGEQKKKESRRLDRIKLRGLLVPKDVHLVADVALTQDGLYPSSHFGVRATVVQEESFLPFLPSVVMDQQCAVVVLPPPSLWETIDAIRCHHHRYYPRWMPHIPLLHPFLNLQGDQGPVVASALVSIAKRFVPFRVRLKDFIYNASSSRCALHLSVDVLPPFETAMYRLYTMLASTYTMCAREKFIPVLTVGHFNSNEVDKARAQLLVKWKSLTFDVTHLHIITRPNRDEAMNVLHSIPLGSFQEPPRFPTPKEEFPFRNIDAEHPSEPLDPPPMVLEPVKSGSARPLEAYFPKDALETWLLTVTQTEYARTCPTHISQRGAMYHIPHSVLVPFLMQWETSIQESDKVPFFIEEVRGEIFRLYVDVDFKLTNTNKIELERTGFVPLLLSHTAALFPGSDLTVCITECHGKWEDRYHPEVVAKSGFRFYFQHIWTTVPTFRLYLDSLARLCEELLVPVPNAPRGITWPEIVNTHTALWDRTRLIGTIKKRKNVWRRYKLMTFVTARGDIASFLEQPTKDNVLMVVATPDYTRSAAQNVHQLLFATTVRVWMLQSDVENETNPSDERIRDDVDVASTELPKTKECTRPEDRENSISADESKESVPHQGTMLDQQVSCEAEKKDSVEDGTQPQESSKVTKDSLPPFVLFHNEYQEEKFYGEDRANQQFAMRILDRRRGPSSSQPRNSDPSVSPSPPQAAE